jgi:hypothetical protein
MRGDEPPENMTQGVAVYMIYNGIKVVSEETGIHPSTLRRWETLGLIVPGRIYFGETMVRIYTDEELGLLKRVKQLIGEGYRVRPAFDKAVAELDKDAQNDARLHNV